MFHFICDLYRKAAERETLGNVVKKVMDKAGFDGHFTNHSLRRSCATKRYDYGVTEQVIQENTGHRSVEEQTETVVELYFSGTHDPEPPTPILGLCDGVFKDRFIFRLHFPKKKTNKQTKAVPVR